MSLREELREMARRLGAAFAIPKVARAFLPPYRPGGQPRNAEFMALLLEGGAAGVSYVLLSPGLAEGYEALRVESFAGADPVALATRFGEGDPLDDMVGLAALNACCQHVLRATAFPLDFETDSLGLLAPAAGDRVGMVGLFPPLLGRIRASGAELVVLELDPRYVAAYPDVTVTLDPAALGTCNKVLCTSTTVWNDTLEQVLARCDPQAQISVVGPTLGYFPDPLFARGVTVVGGTFIEDGPAFLQLLAEGRRWRSASRKFCLRREGYPGMPRSA